MTTGGSKYNLNNEWTSLKNHQRTNSNIYLQKRHRSDKNSLYKWHTVSDIYPSSVQITLYSYTNGEIQK